MTAVGRVTAPDLAGLLEKPDGFSAWLWQQPRDAFVGLANDWCESPVCRWLKETIPGAHTAQVDRQQAYVGMDGWQSASTSTPRWLREYLRAEARAYGGGPISRTEAQVALGEPWDAIEPDPEPVTRAPWDAEWSDL